MASSSSRRGGGDQPPNKRTKMDDTDNSESSEDALHSDEEGCISKVMRVKADHLKCTTCLDYPQMQVFQCCNGHIVCDECIEKITRCAFCRETYGATLFRNRVAETYLDKIRFNCNYRNYGCVRADLPRNRRNAHDIQCIYNPTVVGVRFAGLIDFDKVCNFRICPKSIMNDPQHTKDVIEHLTDLHNLPYQTVDINQTTSIQFRIPTISSKEPHFQPVKLFKVEEDNSTETVGYYLLIQRGTSRRKTLSWAVVGLSSAPEDQTAGNPRSGKITVEFSIKGKTDPDKVAKDGDKCGSNLSWTVKSKGLHEWKDFMIMADHQRPPASFSVPLSFITEFYAQQDNKCEMSVTFGPLVD